MILWVLSPQGNLIRLPLDPLICRVELAYTGGYFGVAVRYVSQGTTALVMVQGIEMPTNVESESLARALKKVSDVGLPYGADAAKNKSRLRESLKALVNIDVSDRDMEAILAEVDDIVDARYELINDLMSGTNKQLSTASLNSKWKWALAQSGHSVDLIHGSDDTHPSSDQSEGDGD